MKNAVGTDDARNECRINRSRDELRSVADYLPAVMAEMNRPRLAVRTDGGFDVLDPDIPGSVYELSDDVLESAEKAFFWIRQLGEKRWVSKQTLCDLADAVLAHIQQQREGERSKAVT